MTRVAHYLRVSTEEQVKGYSLADQRRRLNEHSKQDEIIERIVEEGDSGANPYRRGIARIMELAEAGAIDEVWSTKRDRFFRRHLYRLQLEEDLRDLRVKLRSLDDTGNRFVDAITDEYADEERDRIRERTRSGRMERARQGKVVAGVAPYGFRFNGDKTNFEVEEREAVIIRRIIHDVASGASLNGVATALTCEGTPTPRGDRRAKGNGDGRTWSRAVLRQMILSDCYLPHDEKDLETLVAAGNLDRAVRTETPCSIWWFNRERVEVRYKDDGSKTRRFEDNPRSEWIAVPIPSPGIDKEIVLAARRNIADNRAPSNAGRRSWELSGGVLYCACGRRMATHTAARRDGRDFYYVCGLRRSNKGRCEHLRYHLAGETETRVRSLVRRFLSDPEEVRRLAGEYAGAERKRLGWAIRDLDGWQTRLSTAERRRSEYIDLAADRIITRDDLRAKLAGLDAERKQAREEIASLRKATHELERLDELPELAYQFARDLPLLLEGVGDRPPKDQGELYRGMYEDLGFKIIAHQDGTLEATWKFGSETLRFVNDLSKNKHATKHFHATEHPLVRSFQPGEDWIWCYVDEVVMEPRR